MSAAPWQRPQPPLPPWQGGLEALQLLHRRRLLPAPSWQAHRSTTPTRVCYCCRRSRLTATMASRDTKPVVLLAAALTHMAHLVGRHASNYARLLPISPAAGYYGRLRVGMADAPNLMSRLGSEVMAAACTADRAAANLRQCLSGPRGNSPQEQRLQAELSEASARLGQAAQGE